MADLRREWGWWCQWRDCQLHSRHALRTPACTQASARVESPIESFGWGAASYLPCMALWSREFVHVQIQMRMPNLRPPSLDPFHVWYVERCISVCPHFTKLSHVAPGGGVCFIGSENHNWFSGYPCALVKIASALSLMSMNRIATSLKYELWFVGSSVDIFVINTLRCKQRSQIWVGRHRMSINFMRIAACAWCCVNREWHLACMNDWKVQKQWQIHRDFG